MTEKEEYQRIFNHIQTEWRRRNILPFGNAFISSDLIQYINLQKSLIARLGELHRSLGYG